MTSPARLERAEIVAHGEDYLVRFALDDGTLCEMIASFDALDTLSEEIDRRLDADEE